MKKIRNCPFGYQMQNGVYIVVPEEKILIQNLFMGYLNGASLNQLSDIAEQTGLKFRENATSWNKNMVSRILDNKRYWDEEKYPPILTQDIAMRVASLKKSKASPKSKIPFIRKRMTCPYCGDILQRNSKKSPRVYWDCKGCQNRFGPISDNELQQAVTEKLLAVCRNSQVVELDQQPTNSLSIQAARLTNEINQLLDQREVDTDRLLSLILECATEKYKTCCIKESDHLTIKIKALFQEHSNDEELNRELFEQTVKQVILQQDGSIKFQLLNGKIV